MSKSLGNITIVNDLLEKFDPTVIKYSILTTHYRQPIDFSDELLSYSQNIIEKWKGFIRSTNCLDLDEEFINSLNDDLNTPSALMRLQQIFNELKKNPDNTKLISYFNNGLQILGLNPNFKEKELKLDKEHIENMISRRQQAKENNDFDLADKIRDELQKEGIFLEDNKSGTTWKKI